jgi:hypothetical protein
MLYRPFPTIRGPCIGTGIAPRKDLPDPMSDQTTASQAAASPGHAADGPGALRIIGLAAVGVGLAALAGAAFVLSYAGIHAFAVEAGISARLARGYPLLFDVLLVVILAAVLALRGAGLPSKVLAWACLLAVLTVAAGADALHAAGRKLPVHNAAVTAAVVPWVLVLIAFALLLAMLRHARLRRVAANRAAVNGAVVPGEAPRRWEPQQPPPASSWPLIPGFGPDESATPGGPPRTAAVGQSAAEIPPLVIPRQLTAESAADTAGLRGGDAHPGNGTHGVDLAIDAELAPDDPSSEEAPAGPAVASAPDELGSDPSRDGVDGERAASDQADGDEGGPEIGEEPDGAPGLDDPAGDTPPADESADPEMPVFHRMWSSPVPPAGD